MTFTSRRRAGAPGVQQRRHRPDYWLVIISALLLSVGLIVIYAISPGISAIAHVGQNYYVSKQLLAILLGIVGFSIFSSASPSWLPRIRRPLIIMAAVAAAIVQLFGQEVNGAARWVQLGGFSFQAVELIKFALVIWLADFLTTRMKRGVVADYNLTLKPLIIVMAIVGLVVAVFQSDLGSAGVIMAIIAVMAFVAGMPWKRVLLIGGVVLVGLIVAVSSSSYRRERVSTFLNPTKDCQSSGYQACQALITIGSGGLFGLGLGKSVQAYGYLPEAANDSIFAILAEKFGFVGVSLVIGLYLALFSRLKRIIERSADITNRLIVTGILVWLSTQAVINIGAMMALLPLKGITLPFVSYGGTSLVFTMVALGVAFQISRYTSLGPITNDDSKKGTDYGNSSGRRGNSRPYYAGLSRSG